MSKKILAGQIWRLTDEAQKRAQAYYEVLDSNIHFSMNVTIIDFTMDDKFEVEDLNTQATYVFAAEDFERFVSHAPKEDEDDEDDEEEHLGAPGYYDN